MTNTPKLLAEGQVPAIKGTLYTVPANTKAIIRTVTFANVAATTEIVNLYVKQSGGTSRRISRAQISINEFAHEEDIGTLEPGDEIEAYTTNATSVDYTVHGVEQTT
jgi:hypothetical protein